MTARSARPPNLEDVAARAGVSRATVSRVVNEHATVAPQLRERVRRAVEELGYVPNQAARSLMTRRSDSIAMVASEPDQRVFGDPFFSGILRGVSQEATAAGLQVVPVTTLAGTIAVIEAWRDGKPLATCPAAAGSDGNG